jgi:type I restriction enzyme S subunit
MPELLPFICQTDSFFDHAVGTSAGSLSPRTNWKSLANFEFLLPPIQDQARLVEVFDSIKRLADAQRAISFNVELLYASAIDNVVERVIPNAKSLVGPGVEDLPNTVSLDGITNIVDCKHRTPKLVEVGVPMVAPGDIKWGALDLSGCKQIAEQDYPSFMDHISISHGDIILSRNQTFGVAAYVNDVLEFALGQDTIAIQPRDYSSEFIYLALRSTFCQRQIYKYSAGSTFGRINLGDIRKLRIPIVSDALEQDAIAIFQEFENKLSLVKRRHASSVELLRSTLSSTPLNERADA